MQTEEEILKIKKVKNTAVRTVVLRHLLSQEKAQSLKDIENAFSIARSTVTSILKLMEKKNYITRESVESDARLKKLVLTETGIELHYKIENMITKNETLLDSLLTKEEKKQFLFLINKILSGLENAN